MVAMNLREKKKHTAMWYTPSGDSYAQRHGVRRQLQYYRALANRHPVHILVRELWPSNNRRRLQHKTAYIHTFRFNH